MTGFFLSRQNLDTMPKYLPLPDGNSVTIREGETPTQAWIRAQEMFPASFGLKPEQPEEKVQPKGGFIPALKAGASSLKSDITALAGRAGLMDEAAAEQALREGEAYRAKTFKPTTEGWTEAPLQKTKELLGGSLPYMAAPIVAGALAPEGAAALGATGLASLAQFTGSNISRQMEEGKKLKETSLGSAAAAAIPQAALDVVSFKMAPGIRSIFAAAGKEVPEKVAADIAKQGTMRMLGDYAAAGAKAAGTEGLTEAGQQFFERLQAGLSLTDEKARDEYWSSLVGGAVLGGTLAPPGRYAERSREIAQARGVEEEKRKQAEAEKRQQFLAQQQQEAQAAAEAKQSPEYAQQFVQEYNDLNDQFKKLRAELKKPGKDASFEEKAVYKEQQTQLKDLSKELTSRTPEYRQLKSVVAQQQAEQARAEMTPMEAMLAQQPPSVTPTALAQPETPEATPYTQMATATPAPKAAPVQQYAANQINLANERALTTAKEPGDRVGDYVQYLMADPKMAAQMVQFNVPVPNLSAKESRVVLATLRDALKLQRAATPQAQPMIPTQLAESEEQATLEEARRAEEAARVEAERERRIAPEAVALQRMAKKNVDSKVMGLPGFGTEGVAKAQFPSAAIAQTEQALRGVKPGEELIPTAEEAKPEAERKFQKGPGGGFRLFSLRDAPERPSDYANLSQRLASAMAQKDLGGDAYEFLRRAEAVLPQVDSNLEEIRRVPGSYTKQDVASNGSFFELLDQQLTKIERGEEGFTPEPTARREVSYQGFPVQPQAGFAEEPSRAGVKDIMKVTHRRPTEAQKTGVPGEAKEVPVTKRVREESATTLRGPSARAMEAPALSMQQELEKYVRLYEGIAQENAGQQSLFPIDQSLSAEKKTAEEFERLRTSPYAAKGRKAAREAAAPNVAAEKRAEESMAALKEAEQRADADREQRNRLETALSNTLDTKRYEALTDAQRWARKAAIDPFAAAKEMAFDMDAPKFSEKEMAEIRDNPTASLAGFRGYETKLNKRIQKSQKDSRDAITRAADDLKTKRDNLEEQYKAAKSSEQRAAIEPKLAAAEKAYTDKLVSIAKEPIRPWIGMRRDINQLAGVINKIAYVEEQINRGVLATAEERAPKSAFEIAGAIAKERKAKQAAKAAAAEGATRANAPSTSGEALTRSQAAKAAKAKGTVFQGKGVGPLAKGERDTLAERTEDLIRIKEKQKAGKPLNPFDENTLRRAANAVAKGLPETDFDLASETTSAQQDMLSDDAKEAIADNRLLDALGAVATDSPHEFLRDTAKKLQKLVARTRISISPDLTVKGKDVPAAYNSQENMIGIRPGFETEANLIHEAVHAATMRALEGPEEKLNADQLAAKREITAMFKQLKKDGTLTGEYAAEDVKEFASEVQSNATLRDKMSEKKWYGATMLRRIYNAFMHLIGLGKAQTQTQAAQNLIERLYMQSGKLEGVAEAANVFGTKRPEYATENALTKLADQIIAQPKTWAERRGQNPALEIEMETVDMRAGVREALKLGTKALNNDDMYTQAMYNLKKSDQYMPVVSSALANGAPVLRTDDKGLHHVESSGKDSAKEVFEATADIPAGNSQGRYALLTTYLAALRAKNKGLSALDLGALGVTEEKLAEALADVQADPKLEAALNKARERYNAFNRGMIEFLASTGKISKALAQDLLKDEDYVPYYRVREDGTAELVLGGEKTLTIGDARHQPYLQELKGGETKILPLNESIMRNTMLLTRMGLGNLAAKDIAYAMQAFGEGHGPVGKDGKPTNAMAIHKGVHPAGNDVITFNQEPDPKDPKDDGKRWMRVKTEGTPLEGIPSALVVRSLEGTHLTLPGFLKVGGFFGDLLRKGVTRMPPYILRQLVRDPMAASFTAGLDYNPLTASGKAIKEFVAMQRGESKTGAELIKKGLVQSNVFTGDPDDLSAFALQLASGKDASAIDKLLAMTDRAAMSADSATRALVYENAINNGLSETEAELAVMESMNFYNRGLSPTIQYANRLIPFFNAQIQGLNVLAKAMRGNMPYNERLKIQRKFFNNAMLLAGTGIIYAMAMEDDDYYKNAKPRDKYGNFFLHLPGVEEPVKIPVPYESGWFFSLAVAAADAMKAETDGPQQLRALRDMFLSSVPGYSSLGAPQAIKPVFEVWANKNFFSGYDIESPSMKHKLPEDRYTANTTEAAKALAKILPGLSPVQIEHLARGYFGTLPLAVAAATNDMLRGEGKPETPTARASDLPVFGSMFQRKFGGADADVVYRLAEEAKQAASSYAALKKTGSIEDIKDFLAEHRAEVTVAPLANRYTTNMAKLKQQEDALRNRGNLSADELRDRLDKLDEVRQQITLQFMQRIKSAESSLGKT